MHVLFSAKAADAAIADGYFLRDTGYTATFFGIMKAIVKLVQGCYNIPVMIVTAVLIKKLR